MKTCKYLSLKSMQSTNYGPIASYLDFINISSFCVESRFQVLCMRVHVHVCVSVGVCVRA